MVLNYDKLLSMKCPTRVSMVIEGPLGKTKDKCLVLQVKEIPERWESTLHSENGKLKRVKYRVPTRLEIKFLPLLKNGEIGNGEVKTCNYYRPSDAILDFYFQE